MCPLRFVLIFLSAGLAAFFAFTSFGESSIVDASEYPEASRTQEEKKGLSRVSSACSTLVDMATGRYLWLHYRKTKRA